MKTIVITGASSGIGLATATHLINQGYRVYGLSRRAAADERIFHIPCDVTSLAEVKAAFEKITEPIHAVINNAGVGVSGPVEVAPPEDLEQILAVNLKGVVYVCQAAIPHLRITKGKIINIGSVAGDITIPFQVFYSMTKAAVERLSEGLRMELRPFGITVTTVLPGDTQSGFTAARRKTTSPLYQNRDRWSVAKMEKDERHGSDPLFVSRVVARVLRRKSPPLKITVGLIYKLIVLLRRLLPGRLVNYLIYRVYGKGKSGE